MERSAPYGAAPPLLVRSPSTRFYIEKGKSGKGQLFIHSIKVCANEREQANKNKQRNHNRGAYYLRLAGLPEYGGTTPYNQLIHTAKPKSGFAIYTTARNNSQNKQSRTHAHIRIYNYTVVYARAREKDYSERPKDNRSECQSHVLEVNQNTSRPGTL